MAEDDDKQKQGLGLGTDDVFLDFVGWLVIVILLAQFLYLLPQTWETISNGIAASTPELSGSAIRSSIYTFIYTVAVLFCLACAAGSVYAFMQTMRIKKAEKKELQKLTHAAISATDTKNERWQQILSYAASDDDELWRLAIIEADVMLDEMMATMGYTQDSLGEKLRSVERSDFSTIDKAWEAHKVRNTIAHEGSSYDLNRRELERTIDNYRQVFHEFSYI